MAETDGTRAIPMTPAFASDTTDVVKASGAALWIHDHTYAPFDYRVGRMRVLCNLKGCGQEDSRFDPEMVIELGR